MYPISRLTTDQLNKDLRLEVLASADLAILDQWRSLQNEKIPQLDSWVVSHFNIRDIYPTPEGTLELWFENARHDVYQAVQQARTVRTSPLNPRKQRELEDRIAHLRGRVSGNALDLRRSIEIAKRQFQSNQYSQVCLPAMKLNTVDVADAEQPTKRIRR
jgi:hypothetical protein